MKFAALLLVLLFAALVRAAPPGEVRRRPMTVADLFRFRRVTEPQISPDGQHVVYVISTVDLEGNQSSACLWLAPTDGGSPRQLTNTTKKDRHPRWSPDG